MNVYCKPYLLYGADVIEWNKSILSSISYLFKSVLCIIYKIKFESLDAVLLYTGQMDICHEISRRRCNFIRSCLLSDNTVISCCVANMVGCAVKCVDTVLNRVFWYVQTFCYFSVLFSSSFSVSVCFSCLSVCFFCTCTLFATVSLGE